MANSLTAAIPQITVRTIEVLRENSVMPRLVNNQYSTEAGRKGQTITIPVSNTFSTTSVSPGQYPGSFNDSVPTSQSLTLNSWEAATWKMTDSEILSVIEGFNDRNMDEAIRAVANKVDNDLLSLYKKVPNYVGTAGTTPFGSSLAEAQAAKRVLKSNNAPNTDLFMVVDPFAESNMMGVPVLQRVNESGNSTALRQGTLAGEQVVGFGVYCNQNVDTHNTAATGTYAIDASGAVGDTSIIVDNGAGAVPTASLIVGDKFTIAGSTQQYTVISVTAGTPANADTYGIYPALDQIVADGDLLTVVSTDYVYNLAFHRDAFVFASRPMADAHIDDSQVIQTINDPVSGLTVRFQAQRYWMETVFSVDILYGYTVLRPDLAVVIMG